MTLASQKHFSHLGPSAGSGFRPAKLFAARSRFRNTQKVQGLATIPPLPHFSQCARMLSVGVCRRPPVASQTLAFNATARPRVCDSQRSRGQA
jgi:hypothetical protein